MAVDGKDRLFWLCIADKFNGVLVQRSDDRGESWSQPLRLNHSETAHSFTPSITVSKDGVIGVSWYEIHDKSCFDVYFTASLDGGKTFLPEVRLAKLAEHQRREELKKGLAGRPAPMFAEIRELILRKCVAAKAKQVSAIFEKQPFGELERLVTQKLLDVVKTVVREELNSENWLHLMARLAGRSYEQMRVTLLEFLDTDVFSLSPENCVSFLDPLIESWDVDLTTFSVEIVLNRRIASGDPRRFAFVETGPSQLEPEPGFKEFLKDRSLSGTAATEELELLKKLRFNGKRPTSLYYYRELQSLRDPLHFRAENRSSTAMQNSGRK